MTGVGLPFAGSWTQMLPSPGAKINFPSSGGAGGGVPSNNDAAMGGRSNVAEGRAKSCVEGVLEFAELHAPIKTSAPSPLSNKRNIMLFQVKSIVECRQETQRDAQRNQCSCAW